MHGAINPAPLGILISMATALVTAYSGLWVAMRSCNDAADKHDAAASILFGIAGLLMIAHLTAILLVATGGIASIGFVKATMLLTAAFALAGAGVGLIRGVRHRNETGRRIASGRHHPS